MVTPRRFIFPAIIALGLSGCALRPAPEPNVRIACLAIQATPVDEAEVQRTTAATSGEFRSLIDAYQRATLDDKFIDAARIAFDLGRACDEATR